MKEWYRCVLWYMVWCKHLKWLWKQLSKLICVNVTCNWWLYAGYKTGIFRAFMEICYRCGLWYMVWCQLLKCLWKQSCEYMIYRSWTEMCPVTDALKDALKIYLEQNLELMFCIWRVIDADHKNVELDCWRHTHPC